MLKLAGNLREISFPELMNVYREGNRIAAARDYPEEPEDYALELAQEDFREYLRDCFFHLEEARYAIWEEEGNYVSALRLEPYKDGLLICALETAPDCRGKGYAASLLAAVLQRIQGRFYSHVEKQNIPSLKVHQRCGFRRIRETAAYLDGSVDSKACTLFLET